MVNIDRTLHPVQMSTQTFNYSFTTQLVKVTWDTEVYEDEIDTAK